jgi:hypothetical protein
MRVFISWGGEPSRSVARALRDWLPMVVQHVEPWMSDADIPTGARWNNEVATGLERTNFGIICLTRANQERPWLLFEAGALAKSMKVARVVPLCIDLLPADITGPLATFQAISMNEDGMRRLVHDVSAARKRPIPERRMDELFDAMWPRLESARLSGVVHEMHRHELPVVPPIPPIEDEPPEAEVVDLLTALRASIEAAKEKRRQWDSRYAEPDDEVVLVAPPRPGQGHRGG